jgi:hypothetical protein
MRSEPNPPEHDIDAVYERLENAALDELSRLIPHWSIATRLVATVNWWCCGQPITLTQ